MRPGDQIDGKYEVEQVLGEGGMGLVVSAFDHVLRARVAIKVLKEGIDDDLIRRRFMREARGAGQLRNPHIARIYNWGVLDDGRPYLVMEMLDGPDLQSLLDDEALPVPLAISYIRQACAGLAEAHKLGIVHRDIKPANLMLSRTPQGPVVKVVDFGIATAARGDFDNQLTGAHMVIGSVTYMSPEQLRSSHDIDHRSDVWSLGVTLYELVSGRVPFPGDTWAAVACAVATESHEPLDDVDPRLAAIVDRCLAKDPADRFASVGELAAALANLSAPRHAMRMEVAFPEPPPEVHIFRTEQMYKLPRPQLWTRALLAVGVAMLAFVAFTIARDLPTTEIAASAASDVPAPIVTPILEPLAPSPVVSDDFDEIELPPQKMSSRKAPRAKAVRKAKPVRRARR